MSKEVEVQRAQIEMEMEMTKDPRLMRSNYESEKLNSIKTSAHHQPRITMNLHLSYSPPTLFHLPPLLQSSQRPRSKHFHHVVPVPQNP
jgi:hypothetical protein